MIIKNYFAVNPLSPGLDYELIENCTDILVYAGSMSIGHIGNIEAAGVTSVYDRTAGKAIACDAQMNTHKLTRHIDFTRNGVRSRLIVTDEAYILNDNGKTVETVKP